MQRAALYAEGLCSIKAEGNKAAILEVNSETDFVAKNERFVNFVNTIAKAMLDARSTTVEEGLTAACEGATVADYITNYDKIHYYCTSNGEFTFDFDEQSGHSRLSVGEIPQATNVVMQSIDRRA